MSIYDQPPPPGSPYPAQQTSTLALVSLIMGILGLTLLPLLGSVAAVITGPMARKEIQDSAYRLGGEGLASAGTILGWIGIALGGLGICLTGAIFAIPFCIALFGITTSGHSWLMPALQSLIF
jgi:hypothetical protein